MHITERQLVLGNKNSHDQIGSVSPYIDRCMVVGDVLSCIIELFVLFQITGAKAPPLKYLISWLDKNPAFDVDPKWSHVVLAKVSLSLIGQFN